MKFVFGSADKEKALHGSWFEGEDDQEFLVAKMDGDAFRSRLESLKKPFRRRLQKNEETVLKEDLVMKAISETVLLDWKKVGDPDGKAVPYTPENGYAMLKESLSFRDAIVSFASDEEAYFKDLLEKQ